MFSFTNEFMLLEFEVHILMRLSTPPVVKDKERCVSCLLLLTSIYVAGAQDTLVTPNECASNFI